MTVLAVYSGIEPEKVARAYLERQEFRFKVGFGDRDALRKPFGARFGGTWILVGPDGRVIGRGMEFDPAGILMKIKSTGAK